VRLFAVLLVLLAAACGERGRSNSIEAARADSSAAGYAVGRRMDTARADSARSDSTAEAMRSGRAVPDDSATRALATKHVAGTGADTGTSRGIAATATRARATGTPIVARGDSGGHADTARPPKVPNVAAATPRTDSAAHPSPPAGPVRVNEFLTYDARSRTVSLQLIAGYNGLNGSLNYNGATNGSHGLIVPKGWRVHVAVTNRDSDLQHSAIVVAKVLPPPIEPTDPAFAGAALPRLDEGLQEDETGTIDFVATIPGHFMIACGVPGHAQAGEWLELVVTNSSAPPAYR
jgi:hypothetical protein